MGSLKGQNFRILKKNGQGWEVIAMSTNCSITMNTEFDESSTKDDIGMAAKPISVRKSWQIQVNSLDVTNVGAMLTKLKTPETFTLMWDETGTGDNQAPSSSTECRQGEAYLTDGNFTFDNRTNSGKDLTFTGVGAISEGPEQVSSIPIVANSYTKGQFVRLFLGSNNTTTPSTVIAAAKQLSLHVSLTLEDNTTKDTSGDWQSQEPTALNYDISTTALISSGETITSATGGKDLNDLETIYEAGNPVLWQICNVSGDNQRTKGSVIVSGSALIQTLTINAQNRSVATYTANLVGYGEYTVGS